MLRAVPEMVRNAASSLVAFISLSLILTISITCFLVTLPTLSLLGAFAPDAIPAAFFRRMAAGDDLVMKVKDLS